jgi:hypothetical protein
LARRSRGLGDVYKRQALSGKYLLVPLDGVPSLVRHFWSVHLDRLLSLDLGPTYEPPDDLYCCVASCALRADHSPGSPPLVPAFTLATMRFHLAGSRLVAVAIGHYSQKRPVWLTGLFCLQSMSMSGRTWSFLLSYKAHLSVAK